MQENKQFNAVQADLLQLAGLLTEDHWCQGPQAMDASGVSVPVLSARAVRWCLYGGLVKIVGIGSNARADAIWQALRVGGDAQGRATNPITFNDSEHTTHRQVQEYIMRAVAHAAT